MAAVHSPDAPTRSAPVRRSTIPAAPKLRDSCHTCAASKVKCDKEKPSCARCTKRGLACEYCVTKRASRRHGARQCHPQDVTQAPRLSSSYSSSETGVATSPDLTLSSHSSPWHHTSNHPDVVPSLLSPADSASLSTLPTFSADFDDFFASPISFPPSDSFTSEIQSQPHLDFAGVNSSSLDSDGTAALITPEDMFSVMDEAASDFPTLSKPRSPPNSRASPSSDAQNFQDFRSESRCCCLIRALGLFEQLFQNSSTACTGPRCHGFENATCQPPTIKSVVAENEQTIETISNMLQCPCAQDGYLLAIMSLIVFKVLGSYAAAARETPATDGGLNPPMSHRNVQRHSSWHSKQGPQFPIVVGSYCIDGDDQGRMAAQLILSELHRVQRLVNLLSQRLKGHGKRNGETGTPGSADNDQDRVVSDGQRIPPFSSPMLDQLEADLRKRLRALSLEIVGMLRRG